jgi:hypothetical protein
MIDKLVEKVRAAAASAPRNSPVTDATATLSSVKGRQRCEAGDSSPLSQEPKAHLIFDIISTKKHIGPVPENGAPFRLGRAIYTYTDTRYGSLIATTFVGLTDNTARRVGRDVYYTQSEDLSKTHYPFSSVDREHLFIIFPPKAERTKEPATDEDREI